MSRLEVPLLGKILWVTGDVLVRAELELLLRDASNTWLPWSFRVDSGTEMTTMHAATAKRLGLPFPQHLTPALAHTTPSGAAQPQIRVGFLRARVVGLGMDEFAFPCYFLDDPDAVLPPGADPPCLLGLTGVVDKLRIGFEGTPMWGAPYGIMSVEKI